MRPTVKENNDAHYAALKIVEDAVKAGVVIKVLGVAIRSVSKSTINKKSVKRQS